MIKFENAIVATVFLTLIDTATLLIVGAKTESAIPVVCMLSVLALNIVLSAAIAINHKELSDKLKRNDW